MYNYVHILSSSEMAASSALHKGHVKRQVEHEAIKVKCPVCFETHLECIVLRKSSIGFNFF